MILYQNDIRDRRVYIDYETSNEYFLRMSIVLKRMGIRNNAFFLALYQKELQGVDPHSTNLTEEQIAMISYEVKINPWYFFREVLKVPLAGGDLSPFVLHRGNLAAIWAFLNDIDFGLIMPRQTGKTYVTQSIVTYFMFILAERTTVAMVTKDQILVNDNVQRLKDLRDSIPSYLLTKSSRDWDRKEGVSYTHLQNYYRTATSPVDQRSATKTLRGSSPAWVHFDEIAFIQYNWIMIPSIVNATLAAAQQVRSHGVPAPLIYTTTAGNPDTEAGAYALSLFQEALPFSEKLYDLANRDALLKLIEETGSRKMLYLEFSYKMLGKSEQWFKDASTRTVQTQDDINRDLLNIWQSSSDKAVLPERIINLIRANKRSPNFIDYESGFVVRWYKEEEYINSKEFKEQPMIMGMDTSEGVGRDFTTFVIQDPRDMAVVATCRSNLSNLMQVGKHVFEMLMRFPRMVWIPERNNTGIGIIDFVMEQMQNHNVNPYTRIYNEVVQNLDDPKYKNVNIYNYKEIIGSVRGAFGFRTTGTGGLLGGTRNLLYKVVLMKDLEMNHGRLYDSNLINELCSLTERGGRIDHTKGGHDDTVISRLLSSYMIYFGKNLNIYDIPSGTVLELLTTSGEEVSSEAKEHQFAIRRRIADLEALLAAQPATILKQSYLRELANLRPLLNEELMAIHPVAHTQVHHQERELARMGSGPTDNQMKAFVGRFIRAK